MGNHTDQLPAQDMREEEFDARLLWQVEGEEGKTFG